MLRPRARLRWTMKRKKKRCETCPNGGRELPIKAFGIDRARKDGRNISCRECVRRKMAERRRKIAAGELPARRPPPPPAPARSPVRSFIFPGRVTDFAPLVLCAIDQGGGRVSQPQIVDYAREQIRPVRLQREIVQERVGLALGELFQERAIATKGEAEERIYFRRR